MTFSSLRRISVVTATLLVLADLASSREPIGPQSPILNFESAIQLLFQEKGSSLPLNTNGSAMTSRSITIVTLESPPFMMRRLTENGTFEWYGYCMDFFVELLKHIPYSINYTIYEVADKKYGSKYRKPVHKPGRNVSESVQYIEGWNGLVGDLVHGKADLALAPLAVMAERELVVDYTIPFYDLVGIQILLKKPDVAQDWFKFLTVLDQEVWLSITIAYFITSFVMYLFDKLSPYSHKNMMRIARLRRRPSRMAATGGQERHAAGAFDGISSIGGSHLKSSRLPETKLDGEINSIDMDGTAGAYHLARSHRLFIGSDRDPSPRRRSILAPAGAFKRRRDSVYPIGLAYPSLSQQQHLNGPAATTTSATTKGGGHGSRASALDDYLRSVHFHGHSDSWQTDDEPSDQEDGRPDFGLRDSLWFCITSLTPQGGGEAPQNLSGRVVAGAWWLFCFIIIASYTANLAAFLTVSRLDIPIESLDDLAKQYRIKYAPIEGSAEHSYFERMAYIEEIFYNIWKDMSLNDSFSEEERSKLAVWDYPISDKYTKIWSQIQQVTMPADGPSAVERVKRSTLDDGFALLADANMVKYAVMTDCRLKAVGDEFSRKPIALAVRKGDLAFRDHLSYAILSLINQRMMEVLRERWWTNNPHRSNCEHQDENEGISIESIGGVFVIIFAGVLLSFLVWALEKLIYSTKIWVAQEAIKEME